MKINIFETKTSFYPKIITFWIMNILVMIVIFFYSILILPLYLGVLFVLISFYLIFVKFFQYKLFRFFYKIEFDDENQVITFSYRDNLVSKGKYVLPYSEISLWNRKTFLSTSTFIKDKRKNKFFSYIGVITKEHLLGKKYWNRELYDLVVYKMNSIIKELKNHN